MVNADPAELRQIWRFGPSLVGSQANSNRSTISTLCAWTGLTGPSAFLEKRYSMSDAGSISRGMAARGAG